LSVRDVEAVERLYKGKYPRGAVYDAALVDGASTLNTEKSISCRRLGGGFGMSLN
jgi:hypothetical protein